MTIKKILSIILTMGAFATFLVAAPASNTKPKDYSTKPVEFKSEIDRFNAKTKELKLTSEENKISKDITNMGYNVKKLSVDDTPLFEVSKNDGKVKPLIILAHGAGWHKDLWNAFSWAERGFYAVSIDCAAHGESKDGPLQAPAVWAETVKDIDTLIEYYNTIPEADAKNFGLEGGSMGGTISLSYVVFGKYKPTAIAPQLGNTEFDGSEGVAHACNDKGGWTNSIWTDKQISEFVKKYSVINYPEYFIDVWVFAGNGSDDEIGPPANLEKLKKKIEALGGKKFNLTVFPNCGHEVPASWQNVIPKFCEKFFD